MKKDPFRSGRALLAQLFSGIDASEQRRLQSHAMALGFVAVALAVRALFGVDSGGHPFALLHAAVAAAALAGGVATASTATLTALLAGRLLGGASLSSSSLFAIEAVLIVAAILYLRAQTGQLGGWLATADADVRDLRARVREARILAEALGDLERASETYVPLILDVEGRISDWRAGACRVYLATAGDAVGKSAASLFYPALQPEALTGLLADAQANGTTEWRGTHQRGDGTIFDAEVQLRCVTVGGSRSFTMLVHDLTDRQAAEAFARRAAERQHELREEATLAQQQLASLELVTDPYLNAMPGKEAITTLLDRLRSAVNADGIAIVRRVGFRPRLFWANDGLKPEPPAAGALLDRSEPRTLLIHNDEARVADMSLARWPQGVQSMIAVPMLQGGQAHATMEVVYQRGPRSTDWEIALVQVAAARAASLLPDESYANTGAVA